MTFKTHEDIINLIKDNQGVPVWIDNARKNSKMLNALVYGKEFKEQLIHQIEKIESSDRANARMKYSKDIRDMFARILEPRMNIFSASGGSVDIDIRSNVVKEKLITHLTEFKGNKSIDRYLSEHFFQVNDVDPNGVLFMEYIGEENIYPTYKSINDIRLYKSNGQNLEFILFEPTKIAIGGEQVFKWRLVDEKNDYTIIQKGETFIVNGQSTFSHPFEKVPGVIFSDMQELGSELRYSPIFMVVELAKDYARDKSILTLYKFLQGFPIHWRYNQQCRPCRGEGKIGNSSCPDCNGKGYIGKNDVTDVLNVPYPTEDDPKVAPDLAGFVSPDLKTWEQYNSDMLLFEEKIENTIWGTHRVRSNDDKNETATGRFIDVQPVMNKLNVLADNVEWVHNQLVKFILNWADRNKSDKNRYHKSYGRRFIIEGPDVLLERYEKSVDAGAPWTVLDKLLEEYILSKYRNNGKGLEAMLKKSKVEPFVHVPLEVVAQVFGVEKAEEKQLFGDFWDEANTDLTTQELKKEFKQYYNDNKTQVNNNQINNNNE